MTSTTAPPILAMTGYTAEQKLKNHVLLRALQWEEGILELLLAWSSDPSPEALDAAYERALEIFPDTMQDARSECRGGEEETGVPFDGNYRLLRNYEATSVAARMADSSWVGWLYWHGGGKHGEPEAIEWMEDAYPLDVVEEERMVVVRTFSKPPAPGDATA